MRSQPIKSVPICNLEYFTFQIKKKKSSDNSENETFHAD